MAEALLCLSVLLSFILTLLNPVTDACHIDNLPWAKYHLEKYPDDPRPKLYANQPDECCERSTMFIESRRNEFIGCQLRSYHDIHDVTSKSHCLEICYRFNERWVMDVPEASSGLTHDLCVGVTYTVIPGETGKCTLYREYPQEMGGTTGCNLRFAEYSSAFSLKPQCSFGKLEVYKPDFVARQPRVECNRKSLPWSKSEANTGGLTEPDTTEGNIRVRLYEKLMAFCCSSDTAFVAHPGRFADKQSPCGKGENSSFLEEITWNTDDHANDQAARLACQQKCYKDYQEWVMGLNTRAKHCTSLVINTVDRKCQLYSASSTYAAQNRPNCPLVIEKLDANWGAEYTHELKPQCVLEDYGVDDFGYVFSNCDSTEDNGCSLEMGSKGVLFLHCKMADHSMVVDQVDSVENSTFCADFHHMRHMFDSRLRHEGYPSEIELDIEKMGVDWCGAGWAGQTSISLRIQYHCVDKGKIVFPVIEIPADYSILGMSSECQNATKAMNSKSLHTSLSNCNKYASEIVEYEWRCKMQCLIYFLNFYNEKQYTYPNRICRGAVASTRSDGYYNCDLYYWDIDEMPLHDLTYNGEKCHLVTLAHHQVYLLDKSCYEAFTLFPPGTWESPNVIPWVPSVPCRDPLEAFKSLGAKEITCKEAYKWMPGEEVGYDGKSSLVLFSWAIGYVDEHLKEYIAHDGTEPLAHMYYCLRQCLKMYYGYFLGEYRRACRAVSVVSHEDLPRGKSMFCIYKWIDKGDVDSCVGHARLTGFKAPAHVLWEFVMKPSCYESNMIERRYPHPETYPEEIAVPAPTLGPAPGIDRYVGGCADETNATIHYRDVGLKSLDCTHKQTVTLTGFTKQEIFHKCGLYCLDTAKKYWYEAESSVIYSCKAFTVNIVSQDAGMFEATCNYFDWPQGRQICSEADDENEQLFYSKCYLEPDGLVRRFSDCSKFSLANTGLEGITTNQGETEYTVKDGGTTTLKCNGKTLTKLKCNNGKWEEYECTTSDTDQDCKDILGQKDIFKWHYMSYPYYAALYHFDPDVQSYYGAAFKQCHAICDGAQLASIHSQQENVDIATKIVPKGHHQFWIGLRASAGPLGAYKWEDGTPLDYRSPYGQCPNMLCTTCSKDRLCERRLKTATCVYYDTQDGWTWHGFCISTILHSNVCQMKIQEIGKHMIDVDDSRKQEIWNGFCRRADMSGDVEALKMCKQWRVCQKYLETHTNTKCSRVKHCKQLQDVNVEDISLTSQSPPTSDGTVTKYSKQWCWQKIHNHREQKPHLDCIKKCNIILDSGDEKYSQRYCEEIVRKFRERNPNLTCVTKCERKLDRNEGKPNKKYGDKYCAQTLDKFEFIKPQLTCVKKCKELMVNNGKGTTKYNRNYCAQKLSEYGTDKPELECVRKCREKWG